MKFKILLGAGVTSVVTACSSSSFVPARAPEQCAVREAKCTSDLDCRSTWCVNGECERREP